MQIFLVWVRSFSSAQGTLYIPKGSGKIPLNDSALQSRGKQVGGDDC